MIAGTVRDNLSFPFSQGVGRDKSFDALQAASLMTLVGLEQIPFDREVRTLSGGERHRLALIRGLLWDPRVLVADEPLAGLDPEIASVCFDLLLRFGKDLDPAVEAAAIERAKQIEEQEKAEAAKKAAEAPQPDPPAKPPEDKTSGDSEAPS